MKLYIIGVILIIIIIYTIIDSYLYLNFNKKIIDIIFENNKINNTDIKNNKNEELFLIKYSSIKNKLETDNDYLDFYLFIQDVKKSIYVSIIDNIIYNENQIIEIITNDILKTRLKYDFKKLKNIFVIYKLDDKYNKIIIFYDGLIHNKNRFKFNENDFSGNTIVYKVDLKHRLINHHLQ